MLITHDLPKLCPNCKAAHFNDWNLCDYCADMSQQELEHRLRDDNRAESIAIVSAWVMFGKRGKSRAAWRIG